MEQLRSREKNVVDSIGIMRTLSRQTKEMVKSIKSEIDWFHLD